MSDRVFSRRSQFDFQPNRLSVAFAARATTGQALVDLTVSSPQKWGLGPDGHAMSEVLGRCGGAPYQAEAFGMDSAREAVAEDFCHRGQLTDPSRVWLTASTSEAYAQLFRLLCDSGDEVLVPQPSYPLLAYLGAFDGVKLVPYRLVYDGVWRVDLESVRAARSDRTRAIVVVTPNNPTGSFLRPAELSDLSELDLPVISDEVFADYGWPGDCPWLISVHGAEAGPNLRFALGGLSKACAMPGMKLGFIRVSGPDALVQSAQDRMELILDTYLSVAAPVQHAARPLLELGGAARSRILERCHENYQALGARVEGTAVSRLLSEGGWNAVLRLPAVLDDEQWALAFLDRGIRVQPGYFYDFSAGAYVVVSLLTEPTILMTAVDSLLREVKHRCQ